MRTLLKPTTWFSKKNSIKPWDNLRPIPSWELRVDSPTQYHITRIELPSGKHADPKEEYNLSIIPSMVVLYGTAGVQNYDVDLWVPPENIKYFFPNRDVIMKKSLHDTEGETSPRDFIRTLSNMYSKGSISEPQVKELQDFIYSCDCPPPVIKEKLLAMGYGWILPHVVYAVPKARLVKMTDIMEIFVDMISMHYAGDDV